MTSEELERYIAQLEYECDESKRLLKRIVRGYFALVHPIHSHELEIRFAVLLEDRRQFNTALERAVNQMENQKESVQKCQN